MAQPIHIRITEDGIGTGLQGSNRNVVADDIIANGKGVNDNKVIAKSVYTAMLINLGVDAIKNTFNTQVAMYGDTTGDYIGQTKLNNTMQLLGNVVSVGGSTIAGLATGGLVGGAVGLIVSAGSLAINEVNEGRQISLNVRKTNAGASFNSARIGSILINGNRG